MDKRKSKRAIASTLTFLVLGLIMALSFAQAALADSPPGVPHQFYGTVKNNGALVGAGYTVTAKVDATDAASTNTDADGKYGWSSIFYVNADPGATIEFYVNGVKTAQTATFSAGEMTQLDLTVSGAVAPSTPVALGISTSSLPGGTVNSAYSATLAASGGASPYAWSIASGSLPQGLTLDTSSGVISGTPTTTDTYSFTAQVSDSASGTSSKSLSIQVTTPQTTPVSTTISTDVLGQASSFSTSSGVLSSATTLSSADGSVQLSLNANTSVNIQGQSLTVTAETSPPAAPSNAKLVSAYNIAPNDSTFNPAITLTLKYDPSTLPEGVTESNLYIAFWTGAAYAELPSTVNTQNKTVSTEVAHFTLFAILGNTAFEPPTPTPTGFDVADLEIIPSSAKPGEEVTIIAAVTNSSSSQLSRRVFLIINGANEAEEDVILEPNETRLIKFTTSKDDSGSYNVTIEDKSGSFTISEAATGGFKMPSLSVIAMALGGIVVIVLIIVFTRKKSTNHKTISFK